LKLCKENETNLEKNYEEKEFTYTIQYLALTFDQETIGMPPLDPIICKRITTLLAKLLINILLCLLRNVAP